MHNYILSRPSIHIIQKPVNFSSDISLFKTKEEVENWLASYNIMNYVINPDLSVNVKGDVKLINLGNTLTDNSFLPVKFKKVTGDFICRYFCLNTLQGTPEYIGGDFDCSGNFLLNLNYAPKKVNKNFICNNNSIITLKGFTCYFKGSFIFSGTFLPELKDLYDKNNMIITNYENLNAILMFNKLSTQIEDKNIERKKYKI